MYANKPEHWTENEPTARVFPAEMGWPVDRATHRAS